MKKNLKKCDICHKDKPIWKNHFTNGERIRYCKYCWSAHEGNSHKPTASKPIRSRSVKRAKQESLYNKEAKAFKINNPICQAGIQNVCTTHTSDVHHKAGRIGEMLLEQSKWLAVCRACHNWIETNRKEAMERGFLISRL
jgi:hypothetical protein